MNDIFEKRVRAAAVAGWWTVLIAVGFITLLWVIYLVVMSARPAWLLSMWGPGTDWAFRPAGVVLGHRVPQVRLVADGIGDDLVDVVGEAVAEAGRWTLARFSPTCSSAPSPRAPRTSTGLRRDFGITAVLNVQTDEDMADWGINWHRLELLLP